MQQQPVQLAGEAILLMQMLAADSAAAVARSTDEHDVETFTRTGLCTFLFSVGAYLLRSVRCIHCGTFVFWQAVSICASIAICCFGSEAEGTRCALRLCGKRA